MKISDHTPMGDLALSAVKLEFEKCLSEEWIVKAVKLIFRLLVLKDELNKSSLLEL